MVSVVGASLPAQERVFWIAEALFELSKLVVSEQKLLLRYKAKLENPAKLSQYSINSLKNMLH